MEKINFDLLPIFHQPWWLDITCGKGNWGYSVAKNKVGEITGVLPYYKTSFLGFSVIRMPPLTPYLGPVIFYPDNPQKLHSKYSFEQKTLECLIEGLPPSSYFHQICGYEFENWLPLYWNRFKQTTRYTYVFKPTDTGNLLEGMVSSVRNKIRKAEKSITISTDGSIDDFYRVANTTFQYQSMDIPYKTKMFTTLHETILEKGQGIIFFAKGQNGKTGAALYLIWDTSSAYLWQLGAEIEFRKTGAVQLLIWKAIQKTFDMDLKFNFEGSMLPNIEPVFRAFGGERKPVHQIYKCSNRLFYAARALIK